MADLTGSFEGDKGRMTPLVSVLPTNPPEQLDVILSLYSRTTGHLVSTKTLRVRRRLRYRCGLATCWLLPPEGP